MLCAFDEGQWLSERTAPFETLSVIARQVET